MASTTSAARPSDDQRAVSDFVSREVFYCVSSLVSTIASGYGCMGAIDRDTMRRGTLNDLSELTEQAMELCSPIADYEEAAIQAGWVAHKGPFLSAGGFGSAEKPGFVLGQRWENFVDHEELCHAINIEPYEREIFEHWIVSNWLAEKLAEAGEKVDTDFAGMTVWARTTTGQGIASDSVIERIYDALHADDAK